VARRTHVGKASLYLRWASKEALLTGAVTLLLDTLGGGAMMYAIAAPAGRRAELARTTGAQAARLVGFLLRAVTAPALPRG
jgi:AcrR family transcriptional regulator